MDNLFLDDPNGLPKIAAAFTRLSQNPDDWQSEILNELFRQAPFAGDFEPRLVMNELDPERRYAMGAVELYDKQAVNPRDNSTPKKMQGSKHILIPVIVREGKLSPLDIFVADGKAQPLVEPRLRRAMFRPQLFEAVQKRPGDQDIMNMLYPPYRSGGFGLGGNSRVGSQEKTSSVRADLLDSIHHTIKQADVDGMTDMLNSDPTLRSVVMGNPATLSFVSKLAAPIPQLSSKDMLKLAWEAIPPKVVQVSKIPGGFRIKTAAPDMLAPEENDVDRPTAEKVVGKDMVRQVETGGTVTVSTNPVVRDSLADMKLEVVTEFGEYKVKTKDGKELMGWVFPNCVDLDGTTVALSIFSNGSQSAMQENIAGSPVGKGGNLIDEKPAGHGCFYLSRQGGAVAIIPMDIRGTIQDTDGNESYLITTVMGDKYTLKRVPGLSKIAKIGDGKYGIPADCGWMPMENMTDLSESAGEYVKVAEARGMNSQVEVMYESGGTYSMRGLGLQKLAKVLPTTFITNDQATFNLAVLGMEPSHAKEKLASAKKLSRWCKIDGVRPVTLALDKYAEARKTAAEFISKMPQIKSLLLKEAAALDDPMSVDKVLSIGFLNPENIGTFVSYLPEFEDTLSKLSELLIASRLGLSSLDTGALERVVKHLDKVISGLREMSQQPKA